jgi:nucleoside-diphosphate-sugar epimerase
LRSIASGDVSFDLVRLFVTGGRGALGGALRPLAESAGHDVCAPSRSELDLFDGEAVCAAVRGADAVLHLASRIPPVERMREPEAWRENDRLRSEATKILVGAALVSGVAVFVQPAVTFVYPPEEDASEDTPLREVRPHLRSSLVAERETLRFAESGRRGVVLRLGLLDGPGTGNVRPNRMYGATLYVTDAARALVAALTVPTGVYNVCRDGERVSNQRFSDAASWRPLEQVGR